YQKGPFYFIEAAQKVLEKFPDAHFVMAGSGDLFPRVLEKVAHLNLSSRFHFTGFISGDKIEKLWAVSDVYVMPSVSEPFGITPLEAIQSGVPVIVSNQSGVAEVMPHAIKVDFWKTEKLASAICGVLAYDSLSKALRENSLKEIENLTWDRTATTIKHIYHELT
ncbi:MAG TPA: glycosyltransferase family 4 protein, partial [Ohtaekwangia sp.]